MIRKGQEWISHYVWFDMIQPGFVSDRYLFYVYIYLKFGCMLFFYFQPTTIYGTTFSHVIITIEKKCFTVFKYNYLTVEITAEKKKKTFIKILDV